jgi:Fic family protein
MAYQYIKPIPDNAESLSSTELAALSKVWSERKATLQQSQEFNEFIKKLRREWAIETGIIERLYQWDRGVTEVLIEQGIDASLIAHRGGLRREDAEYVRNLILDQQSIIEGLFDFVKGGQQLSEFFIRSMHQQLTAHQETTEAMMPDGERIQIPLLKGKYKELPNNPRRPDGQMHEYCPPGIATEEEMGRLLRWYQEAEVTYSPEVMSAWLHHRFTQIHPFQDGNGRIARALASLVFLKAGLFPLVVKDSDRTVYIEVLEQADQDDLGPLVALFARLQRDAILKALGIEQQVKQARYAEQIISSAIRVLEERATAEAEKLNQVYQTAARLHSVAYERMEGLAQQINQGFRSSSLPRHRNKYKAKVSQADASSAERSYFQSQIIQVAQHLNYFAGLERYRSWVRLAITTEQTFEVVLSFHGYGNWNNGIMVASAFTARRVPREEGGTETIHTVPASVDLFQFNYAESQDQAEERFRDWFEATLTLAMAEWKRSLEG